MEGINIPNPVEASGLLVCPYLSASGAEKVGTVESDSTGAKRRCQPSSDGQRRILSNYYTPFQSGNTQGFPGGAVVGNLPANAGDTGSSPGLGRSRMPRSSWAREPQLLSLRVWSLCSATGEAAIVRGPRTAMKSGPHLPQLEKALAQKRRPDTAKNK